MKKRSALLLSLMFFALPVAAYADIAPLPEPEPGSGLGLIFTILGAAVGVILVVLGIVKKKKK